jgi:hypothetical protein
MKAWLQGAVLLLAAIALLVCSGTIAATNEYTVTLPRAATLTELSRLRYQASTNLVGKSITDIYGPIAEVRITTLPFNRTGIEDEVNKVAKRVRERIDMAKCVGRDREVVWHKAPWLNGYILLKDGGILPIEIMMSGIIVGDLLFGEGGQSSSASEGRPVAEVKN